MGSNIVFGEYLYRLLSGAEVADFTKGSATQAEKYSKSQFILDQVH